MSIEHVVVVYGGELAKDVAEQVEAKKPAGSSVKVTIRCADDRPKALTDLGADTLVCFILQTIENASPTEDVSCSYNDDVTFVSPLVALFSPVRFSGRSARPIL